MNQQSFDDDNSAWDYSFPPSEESLPMESNSALPSISSYEDNTIPDPQKDDTPFASISIEQVKKVNSAAQSASSLPLSSPFLSKAAPAGPLTTREDASSVMSRESNKNALASLDLGPEDHVTDGLQRSGSTRCTENAVSSPNTPRSPTFHGSPTFAESPKIITYRKSKRTTSEYNFQDILDADAAASASPRDKYDPRLYTEEKFIDSMYHYASMKRNTDFHQLFRSLDLTDRLLDDFACALSREILLQGRIYVSEQYVCFNSSLLGWVTNLVIKQEDIIRFEKKSTAGIFPNGIAIVTRDGRHNFASFISRDSTFDFMKTVWEGVTGLTMVMESVDEVKDSSSTSSVDKDDHGDIDDHSENAANIESFIMSLDGDDSEKEPEPRSESVEAPEGNEVLVMKFKPDSGYTNHGPDICAPTKLSPDEIAEDHEIELYNDVIKAPMGVVYEILFGSKDGQFFQDFLESQDSSELTGFGQFVDGHRQYSYRKALGYSIGPKSTTCEVEETVLVLDWHKRIVVETATRTPDVPSGNSFSVRNKYRMSWDLNGNTRLQVTYWIDWVARSWIKGMIEKSTKTGQVDSCTSLVGRLSQEIQNTTHKAVASADTIAAVVEETAAASTTASITAGVKESTVVGSEKLAVLVRMHAVAVAVGLVSMFGLILIMQLYIIWRLNALEQIMRQLS
ncbi:hypothetical protein CANTEDRAFT_125757 [Yamadazyma tenuis ATCC 10573]|uniref:VASt domain-containing protein n=1 Tax=Candida tenuis (strain ATCC 10573 / BCRC 21748 / CBS 615 / JCM 9827 / NBRC 10315 / NRRL Y-1498 / VKM Y-70) TaxID=590646 RepID=G3BBD4_CANTC|nr:uncharacterized protein CANTEDRAFT_125757 [Yamadazyma tenuis ATCC 10573]EGV62159.1 hypothetical protein CANTEDRAFT_125757 [Yamadazyma tenuis ATCC 10573]